MSDNENVTTVNEELPMEDKKKAINLQDLVYVKSYIDNEQKKYEEALTARQDQYEKETSARSLQNANDIARIAGGSQYVGMAREALHAADTDGVNGYRKRLILSIDTLPTVNAATGAVIGTHNITDFTNKKVIVETRFGGGHLRDLAISYNEGEINRSLVACSDTKFLRVNDGFEIRYFNTWVDLGVDGNITIAPIHRDIIKIGNDGQVQLTQEFDAGPHWIKVYIYEPINN